jgi:hypothetical protein
MNQDVKGKWVAALRSDKFSQGTGYLNVKNAYESKPRFCCLGVLCELAADEGITTRREHLDAGRTVTFYGEKGEELSFQESVLPTAVREWAGLDAVDPELLTGYVASNLNDDMCMSFEAIADIVEARL